MTIQECIDYVDNTKPNSYSIEDKVKWLARLDTKIANEIINTHELLEGESSPGNTQYDVDEDMSTTLLVGYPYDDIYPAFISMKIDEYNGETSRYNNSASMFNTLMTDFAKEHNRTHIHLSASQLYI